MGKPPIHSVHIFSSVLTRKSRNVFYTDLRSRVKGNVNTLKKKPKRTEIVEGFQLRGMIVFQSVGLVLLVWILPKKWVHFSAFKFGFMYMPRGILWLVLSKVFK